MPTKPVQVATFLAEDGEEKGDERQWNLVQDPDQVVQLAAYELWDARELGEIVLTCKPRLRRYGPGDLVIVDLPEDGLSAQPCVILRRTLDPATMTVQFVLVGETAAKHAFALGQTATVPPTPALGGTEAYDAAVPQPIAVLTETVAAQAETIAGQQKLIEDQTALVTAQAETIEAVSSRVKKLEEADQ